jgi:[1-hydroxy-2-(trimethylamino)ethyl]phosphonate dioxygenase
MSLFASIRATFCKFHSVRYSIGEPLTILEHSVKSFQKAREKHLPKYLQVAAFMHDYGHLLAPQIIDPLKEDRNDYHEYRGAIFLMKRNLPPEVWQPILLHTRAKAYLARDDNYRRELSPASQKTLKIQGGVMDTYAARRFESEHHFLDALQLRLVDDQSKTPPDEWEWSDIEACFQSISR